MRISLASRSWLNNRKLGVPSTSHNSQRHSSTTQRVCSACADDSGIRGCSDTGFSSALFSGAWVSRPMPRDTPSTGTRVRRRSRERSGPVWTGRPDTACSATGLARVGPRASETVGRHAVVGQPSAARLGVSSAFLLSRQERASAALPAAVLIKIPGAGEPLKFFGRPASVARGFDERAVGFATSATIDSTAVRRHPSLRSSNESDVIRCASVAASLAVHGASEQGRARCVPPALCRNPREMTWCSSSVWCGPDVYPGLQGTAWGSVFL
jgi:hypothetical protein